MARVSKGLINRCTHPPPSLDCASHNFLDFYCAVHYLVGIAWEPEAFRLTVSHQSGRKLIVVKIEDIQHYGKEHLETVVAAANTLQGGFQAIANAYGEYAKKSFEDGKAFVEQLAGVKSLDKAIEVQTEYAKSAYETFVAESQKIAGLYGDLAKQSYRPFEGLVAKFNPAAAR